MSDVARRKVILMRSSLWFLACGVLAACFGNGDPHHDHTVVRVDDEPMGGNCQYGGTAIHTGVDTDHDSALDDSEITSSQYICSTASEVKCLSSQNRVEGPVSLQTSADFAALAGVNCIDGDLMIVGTALAAFPATSSLETVTGSVIVAGNSALVSLDGFPSLTKVGRRYVAQGNDALVDIGAIGGLERFDMIAIVGNNSLVDLSGLETFTDIDGGIEIANNGAMTSLHGLDNLVRSTSNLIQINSNRNLTSLAALNQLQAAVRIEISGNATLPNIRLPSLETVDVNLFINTNAAITSVELPALVTIGSILHLQSNPALTTVTLPELVLSAAVETQNNSSLATFSAPKLAYVTANFDFLNLPTLTQANFTSLVAVGGRVYWETVPQLANLSGFSSLSSIGGSFTVRACNALVDFTGLSQLVNVAGMTVMQNAELTSFAGLTSFQKVGGDLMIVANPKLPAASAQAFANAITVSGTTTIN
jgi:hypothetical protein